MFRKIHSNRDPKATLYSELRHEFGSYFNQANDKGQALLRTHPKPAFWLMLCLLFFSAALSFTVFRHPAPAVKTAINKTASQPHHPALDDGFSRILATGAALQQTLHLKSEVEALLGKGRLNTADSLVLERVLDSLVQIHHQINSTHDH